MVNMSSRKPILLVVLFAFVVICFFMLFIARQESFLKSMNDLQVQGIQHGDDSASNHQQHKPVHYHHHHHQHLRPNDDGGGVNSLQIHPLPPLSGSSKSESESHRPRRVFKDKIDDSGAKVYLLKYMNKFAPKDWVEGEGNPDDPRSITQWWQAAAMIDWYINSPLRYQCKNKVAYGNWHACQDEPYTVKPPCLVYSFGINWDYSFDDAMGKLGCEVHSFDPSMGVGDHQRSVNVTFHNLGLGSVNTDAYVAREDMYVKGRKLWKLRTVKAVKEMLGHSDRVIDVFKMDVEGYEWSVVDNMMETNMYDSIRQYMLEFHLFPKYPLREDYVYLYNIYRRLREMGMREFSIGPHPKTLTLQDFNNQGDSEFVNVNFGRR